MYSEEDIARLKVIKHLVNDVGLNLAGVKVALNAQDVILKVRNQLALKELRASRRKKLIKSIDESLHTLGTVLGNEVGGYIYAGGNGDN
jgi:DNA-binding transcriptional MerR regulator